MEKTAKVNWEDYVKWKSSVLIQVPYELESAYSPLEERTDIDYTVMSVDNFNVGDF